MAENNIAEKINNIIKEQQSDLLKKSLFIIKWLIVYPHFYPQRFTEKEGWVIKKSSDESLAISSQQILDWMQEQYAGNWEQTTIEEIDVIMEFIYENSFGLIGKAVRPIENSDLKNTYYFLSI